MIMIDIVILEKIRGCNDLLNNRIMIQQIEAIIPAIFPIFKIPFNKKGSKKIIKLIIKNKSNRYFIIFIVSPTWIYSNKK